MRNSAFWAEAASPWARNSAIWFDRKSPGGSLMMMKTSAEMMVIVTIIVTGFVGPYSEQIRIVGQATRPQTLPYRENMSLLDVMIAVGGLTDFAAGNRATILRTREGNTQYRVRLNDLLQKGDVSANVDMRPGDVLIIPESYF